jgi:general secretion pathway protein E/type IV pilus assembly protein PilB
MELFRIDGEIDELISRRATAREVREAARRRGFRTLAEDAINRVLTGETDLDEVSRIVDLTDRID